MSRLNEQNKSLIQSFSWISASVPQLSLFNPEKYVKVAGLKNGSQRKCLKADLDMKGYLVDPRTFACASAGRLSVSQKTLASSKASNTPTTPRPLTYKTGLPPFLTGAKCLDSSKGIQPRRSNIEAHVRSSVYHPITVRLQDLKEFS